MEKRILKNLFVYTLMLIVVDLFMNIILNLIQRNPGVVIAVSSFVRIFFLLIFFPLLGSLIFFLIKHKTYLALFLTTIAVYIILPSVVYLLKSNNKSLLDVYIQLHVKLDLFVIIFLPYIVASLICMLISNRIKLF